MLDNLKYPLVSVILPVRNEVAFIKRSLGAVLAQDYPLGCLEILVVDGMSSDGTRELIQEMMVQSKYPISIIDNFALITPAALNKGFSQAKGDIIIRVDGHCEIAHDYVKCCVLHLQEDGVDAVGGAIETLGDTYLARAIALAMSTSFGVGNSMFRTTKNMRFFTDSVPFPAYKREIIIRAGGYDETMMCNEDDEYNYRLIKLGSKILLANDIKSRYYSRGSYSSLWRQYFRYGFWKVRVLQKHPHQMRLRQFVPLILVLALLFLGIGAAFYQLGFLLFLLLLGSYSLATLIASLMAANGSSWGYLPHLPLIYFILHISYGTGFLLGLVKFANRWKEHKIDERDHNFSKGDV
jgi:succinoglycan biosynthesis protein ExoA